MFQICYLLKIGNYGKTIINNSSIKCIFNLEEDNILSLSDNIDLNQKEQIEIRNLKRGESLIIAENNKIRYLTDAKFVSEPSEMIYKSLVKGLYSNCAAKPIFSPNAKDLRLKVSIISLQIRGDKAEVSLAYELFNANTSLKSGMITKEIFCPDPSSSTIFETINKAANLAIDTLISEIIY